MGPRSPSPRPAPSSRRSTPPRPSSNPRPACTRAGNIRARAIRPAPRSRRRSPNWKAGRRLRLRLGPGGRGRRCSNCSTMARTWSLPTTSTAAAGGSSTGCASARPGSRSPMSTPATAAAIEAAVTPATRMIWVETPGNPLLQARRPRRDRRDRPGARHPHGRRQHLRFAGGAATTGVRLRHRRPFRNKIRRRPFRHRRRRRGRSATMPIWSSGSPSCRTPPAACSTRSSSFLALRGLRRCRCAWSGTPPTRSPSPASSSVIRRSRASSIRACPSHPQHDLAARQMTSGGGMVSFFEQGQPEPARSGCSSASELVRARRVASAASRAWSAIPGR